MFKRPGEVHAGAFGISFAADRDTDAGPSVFVNKNEALALQEQRKRLPIYKHRTEILYAVEHHACTILVGETGSGKTTQIPQYLLEAGWNEGNLNFLLAIMSRQSSSFSDQYRFTSYHHVITRLQCVCRWETYCMHTTEARGSNDSCCARSGGNGMSSGAGCWVFHSV